MIENDAIVDDLISVENHETPVELEENLAKIDLKEESVDGCKDEKTGGDSENNDSNAT